MKYINKTELAKMMNYSSYNSFMTSKTNKDLLIKLVEYIEEQADKASDNRILELKKSFTLDLLNIIEKNKQD